MSRDFDLGDQVWINQDTRVGDQPIGGRVCTVRGVHKGLSETGLSLTDRNNELMCVNQNDVTPLHRTAVRFGDAVHQGTELAWTLLFWACVVVLPGLFGVWGAKLVLSSVDWPQPWPLVAAIPAGLGIAVLTVLAVFGVAACIDTPQAGETDE